MSAPISYCCPKAAPTKRIAATYFMAVRLHNSERTHSLARVIERELAAFMKNLKERVRKGETLFGCFLGLGSPLTAEIMGMAGYDWALIDLEHGAGDERETLFQLQALEHTSAAAIVRVESNARQRVHRVLDLGAHGIMFPRIDNAEQARHAVAAMRYPPSRSYERRRAEA